MPDRPALSREAARSAWQRVTSRTRTLVVNTDIDGLLCAALLVAHHPDWQIGGLYDNERLWADEPTQRALSQDLDSVLWVDLSMCWPGCRSVTQHVVATSPADLQQLDRRAPTTGPSHLAQQVADNGDSYRYKYPFGLFQYLWWLHGQPPPLLPGAGSDRQRRVLQHGLLWMPDGGVRSICSASRAIRANCLDWVHRRLPGMPMSPLLPIDAIRRDADGAPRQNDTARIAHHLRRDYLQPAFEHLRDSTLLSEPCWDADSLQLKLSGYAPRARALRPYDVVRHTAPRLDLTRAEDLAQVNTILARIGDVFGWPAYGELRGPLRMLQGERHEVAHDGAVPLKPDWQQQANEEGWLSVAFTGMTEASYTKAGPLAHLLAVPR